LERRQAYSADAANIVGWFSTAAEATSWGGPKVPQPLTAEWLAGEFEKGNYWVWIDQSDKIGGIFGLIFPGDGLAHLIRFAIAPELRGRRLAKGLMEEIKELARSLRAKQLSLWVYGSNHVARHVYDEMGFQLFGERVAAEDPSGVSHKMRLDLQP
jgi:ribosomal protein S18 acetylase RimI-like enzyme